MRHWLRPFAVLLWLSASACTQSSKGSTDGGTNTGPRPEPVDAGQTDTGQDDAGQGGTGTPPPGASEQVQVTVPESLRTAPFDSPRTLTVPPGFTISVFARVPEARFMAIAPNGDVLVSQPDLGTVKLVRPRPGQTPEIFDWATGLRGPHDIVFHTRGGTTWVYVAETNQVTRSPWQAGETQRHDVAVLVSGLPDASQPELPGPYGHALKNIAVDPEGRLYVSIASTCNVCLSDTRSTPERGALYRYGPEGGSGQLFARGLRKAEGLAFVPGTDTLWVTVNARDDIPYPHDDGTGRYGKVIPEYADKHPPEALTSVREAGEYGWPFCNPNPDTSLGLKQMPFDRDYDLNREGTIACGAMDRFDQGIQAHSAPLGLAFLNGTAFPEPYTSGVVVAYHGSSNSTRPTGYKVTYFPWDKVTGQPTREQDFVSGWVSPDGTSVWGRPVDVAVTADGALLISDDQGGALYLLRKQ
ncbi:sugar dehydrogenase [Archangium violaceum]|uniref:PQQ-dependent sugar dehydrogenase n=1 Tax=Archangium violaceum TaxID=83451 RepID=UPI00193BCE42|nr:sugar dehydrogenase [Archangium violaceum]QRK13191.1 sugar dehydrogenase [Archangium violaceum]